MASRTSDQIKVLEKLIGPVIRSKKQAQGGLMLAELYISEKATARALALLQNLSIHRDLVDNVIALNSLIVQLGDELASNKSYAEALAAYRQVKTREEVIGFQADRIATMNLEVTKTPSDPSNSGAIQEGKAQLEQAKTLLAEFSKMPDYWPAVLFRMASAYYEAGKRWEALVVFDRLLADYPDGTNTEAALFASVICSSELSRGERTLRLCRQYSEKFPKGPNAPTVGYLTGVTALQNNDAESAIRYLQEVIEKQPDSKFREEVRFLLGNANFMKGSFSEARESYKTYAKDYPQGVYREEASYRVALSLIYEGNYEEALSALQTYLREFPSGAFAADAGYRILVSKYAARRYEEIVAEVPIWEKQHPNDSIRGEVLSLLGDALAGLQKPAEAAAAYTRAYRAATSDEVLNYALMEAGSQLRKQGKWDEGDRLFQGFVKERPGHPTVVAALYWIGKAKARQGKLDEAKVFLVTTLQEHIGDPTREAVEQLLQQLAQLCVRPSQPKPSYDPIQELRTQLEPLKANANQTTQARILYAEAELLPLIKRAAEVPGIWKEIDIRFAPADLSAPLLAGVGDYLLSAGRAKEARQVFELLRDRYSKSNFVDSAEVGLGQIALTSGDARQALQLFSHAADEIPGAKLKEATLGKACAQFELGRFSDAKQRFQEVAGNRDWRGESTAQAVFYLGEIEAKQGRWPEAISYYQRVFVAYQKYLPWVAKSYVRCAEAFDRLGKRQEAIGHLKEMLRNDKLKDFAETKQALKMLSGWGES
jgi:TolA-binding protein